MWRRPLWALARAVALGWLLVVGPAELAVTIGRLLSRLVGDAEALLVLIVAARSFTVALGMAVGLALLRESSSAVFGARLWALLELATMALVLATTIVPSNLMPGTRLPISGVYASLVMVVLIVAGRSARPGRADQAKFFSA